jgi:SAM-dependent methyltransferase
MTGRAPALTSVDPAIARVAYQRGCEAYDAIWSPVILPPAESVVAALAAEDARLVLDVGAGTGALTPALRRAAPAAVVVSLDPSSEMLRRARVRHGVIAVLGDAANLPFLADQVDVVVLAYVLFHLPDPSRAISEARRVLRGGGRLATVTWAREWPSLAQQQWEEWLDELGVPSIRAASDHAGLATTADIEALLGSGGFTDVRAWYEIVEVTFPRADFWRLQVTQGARAVRLAALDPTRRAEVLRELRRRLDGLDQQAFHHQGEVVCSVSTKADHIGAENSRTAQPAELTGSIGSRRSAPGASAGTTGASAQSGPCAGTAQPRPGADWPRPCSATPTRPARRGK